VQSKIPLIAALLKEVLLNQEEVPLLEGLAVREMPALEG
jgi:hypothetical protein